jgi:uncharacterized protein (TIGR00661 family)
MKILYGIQGTGNGHISRAIEIIPYLQKWGHTDILISGLDNDIDLPFDVKYRNKGLGYIFGSNGGIDFMNTYLKNKLKRFYNEIKELPVEEYDLVISDFEPVTAWACYIKNKPCIGLSNQVVVMAVNTPQPKKVDPIGKLILKNYCPVTTGYGFHYRKYNEDIFTPILRKEVRDLTITTEDFYLVYLPSYNDRKIIKTLNRHIHTNWRVFSKHAKKSYKVDNVEVMPINKEKFLFNMASCSGILCNAGFTTTSEALFLKKKLIVIPMKGQFEQKCNAMALRQMGVPVLKSLKPRHHSKIAAWLSDDLSVDIDFPDETEYIIDMIVDRHVLNQEGLQLIEKHKKIKSSNRKIEVNA